MKPAKLPARIRKEDAAVNSGREVWALIYNRQRSHLVQALKYRVEELDYSRIKTGIDSLLLEFGGRCLASGMLSRRLGVLHQDSRDKE